MLSKRELKERYEILLAEYQIRHEINEKRFCNAYLEKAFHNLELAGSLGLRYSDWIIIISYYSMYMASNSALARLVLKTTTHSATIIALEYNYCINKNLLPRRFIEMIEDARFGREDIHKLDEAMKQRLAVQYTITKRHTKKESRLILKNAKMFVNKISDIISQLPTPKQ